MKTINGKTLYGAFYSGARALIDKRDVLNEINVFPVPDGDTGTNMATTVHSVLYQIEEKGRLDQMAAAIDDGAMRGARGNSGMILAQYFHGLALALEGKETASVEEMIDGFKQAVPVAYSAVDQPQEGTILTLMRVLAETLEKNYHLGRRGNTLIDRVAEELKIALQLTMNQLEPLKRNQVIDSGAAGFLAFIEGIQAYIQNPHQTREKMEESLSVTPLTDHLSHDHSQSDYRYCTEGIVEGIESAEALRSQLAGQGDSLIVLDRGDVARFHIHTQDPAAVFDAVAGKIVMQKVEDMDIQSRVVAGPRSTIAVLTDSIADLDPQWVLDHQVHVIPVSVLENEQVFLDRLTYTNGQVLNRVKEGLPLPTSSVPSPSEIKSRLTFLQSYYEGILVLTVSGKMSGLYGQMKRIAMESFWQFPIEVVDTCHNSASQGLLVKAAVEAVEGGASLQGAADQIRALRNDTRIFVAIHDLKPMIQGGRLSVRTGKVFQALGIQPIISIDDQGAGTAFGMHARFAASLRHLERIVKREAKAGRLRVQVSHVDSRQAAVDFAEKLSKIPQVVCEGVTEISPIVTASAGSGAIAVAFMKEGEK